MDIILLERVEKLGQMGDVVKVKDGYARNYLLPQKKALRATSANKETFEAQRAALEKQNAARRGDAEKNSVSIDGKTAVLLRQASESGQLYGSVSARDVADAASALGVAVDRKHVSLDRAIKSLGVYPVRIFLHPEVPTTVQVIVARSETEAQTARERLAAGGDGNAALVGGGETEVEAKTFFEEGAGPAAEASAEAAPADEKPAKKKRRGMGESQD